MCKCDLCACFEELTRSFDVSACPLGKSWESLGNLEKAWKILETFGKSWKTLENPGKFRKILDRSVAVEVVVLERASRFDLVPLISECDFRARFEV